MEMKEIKEEEEIIIEEEKKELEENYTFDEGLNRIGFGSYQLYLLFVCGAGWFFGIQNYLF
jgi:hypothetical protein